MEGRIRRKLCFDISFAQFGQGTKKLRPRNRGGRWGCRIEREVRREKCFVFIRIRGKDHLPEQFLPSHNPKSKIFGHTYINGDN